MFRSVWDRIHYGTDPFCLHGTDSKLERYCSILDHISGPIWLKIADPISTGSTRSRVNTRLIRWVPILYRFQTDPVPCKRCLNLEYDTPFYKFILNMRLLLQFPTVLSDHSVVNLLLNSTIDKKRAFS